MMQIFNASSSKCSTICKGYAKIRSTEPKIFHPTNPDLMRQLTVKEHAAVKCIPVNLVTGMSNTVAHELLGQAIIYPVFQAIGAFLGRAIKVWHHSTLKVVKEVKEVVKPPAIEREDEVDFVIYPTGHQYALFG